jgi:outer membrane immunogenic protein
MKKLAFTVAALAISGSAFAADLPSRKAAPVIAPPPPPMWTGFHVGLNAGGTWGNNNGVNVTTWPVGTYASNNPSYWALGNGTVSTGNGSGFIGGGQVGYDWQVPYGGMGFVAGVEADIQGIAGTSGGNRTLSAAYPITDGNLLNTTTASGNLQYLGTVRGRLGYLVNPTFLIYGTGGLAYGGVSFNLTNTAIETNPAGAQQWIAIGNANYSNTQVGWTGGGGVEWMFMPNWSAKAEYLYYDLGNVSMTSVSTLSPLATGAQPAQTFRSSTYSGRINGNLVRAGVNYHFNWGAAPVVAKY